MPISKKPSSRGKRDLPGDDRVDKKAQVSNHNDQERPVKQKTTKPEPFGAAVNRPTADHLHVRIPEKGPKQEYLLGHSCDHAPSPCWIFHRIGPDPGQGFLLAARCGNTERDGRFGPQKNTPDKADQENGYGDVRQDDIKIPVNPTADRWWEVPPVLSKDDQGYADSLVVFNAIPTE